MNKITQTETYPSLNIIKVSKSKQIRWAGQLACIKNMINSYKILVGNPEGKTQVAGYKHI
jgi:hypothetical protein